MGWPPAGRKAREKESVSWCVRVCGASETRPRCAMLCPVFDQKKGRPASLLLECRRVPHDEPASFYVRTTRRATPWISIGFDSMTSEQADPTDGHRHWRCSQLETGGRVEIQTGAAPAALSHAVTVNQRIAVCPRRKTWSPAGLGSTGQLLFTAPVRLRRRADPLKLMTRAAAHMAALAHKGGGWWWSDACEG